MSPILIISADEWRYWMRSRLALASMALLMLLLVTTAVLNFVRMDHELHARVHQQSEAEETFLSQPDRHPHRMVHYGHYVFRTPAPLAVFDPGLDPVTGQSIFLEGHRQNSAMFADASASAELGGLAFLTPALVYQVFVPLLIILLGHSSVVREREAATLAPMLAQGVRGTRIVAGKALALGSVIAILLVPMVPGAAAALGSGESGLAVLSMFVIYALYLGIWCGLVLLVSATIHKRSVTLALLTTSWLVLALVIPAAGVNLAATLVPAAGKIETDLMLLADLREIGDGHNASAPAFARLRADLLEQYEAESVEDLPVNMRGIVAQYAEQKLTETMNRYADNRMAVEVQQADLLALFGWFSPVISIGAASRAVAGTDLDSHHRFLREAETLRYGFVQSLNQVHAVQLAYADDINRSTDSEAEARTRVAAENWGTLDEFRFEPSLATARLTKATSPAMMLLVWLATLVLALVSVGRRLKP